MARAARDSAATNALRGTAIGRAGAGDLSDGSAGLGLDTLLGTCVGGRAVSGGQWQRLAQARGLMRERPLLIVMDRGRVAESGDHRALIEQGGIYAELFALQAAGYQA